MHIPPSEHSRTQHSATVVVRNPMGLHARPAAALVKLANQFTCEIWLSRGTTRSNAKSIMGVLLLAAPHGTTLQVDADGDDSAAAVAAFAAFFETAGAAA